MGSSCVMNIGLRLLYGNEIFSPFSLAISARTQCERFPRSPVTITVVFLSAKLVRATTVSGSIADEASTRKYD
ncbi:hypothetical protein Prudu_000557 [Prunus dulcis]|uniref:Uncharacterized protein n=1 Tax=Prunus dulcis TaxID=3755 RepID=A0A4Y1QLS5_PRUDU|nr:hypothetical protein Prudu_000557 [Prunus dulcis]